MSRKIKFRLYSKPAKKYIDYITIGFLNTGELRSYSTENGFGPVLEDNYIVEQYTGSEDKNGKEIYEGDIVEEDIDFNSKMTDGTFRYKVYWNEDELYWSLDPIGPESIHNDLWELNSSCRVIGNVHENKGLLGDEE